MLTTKRKVLMAITKCHHTALTWTFKLTMLQTMKTLCLIPEKREVKNIPKEKSHGSMKKATLMVVCHMKSFAKVPQQLPMNRRYKRENLTMVITTKIGYQMKTDPRSFERNYMQLRKEAWSLKPCSGFFTQLNIIAFKTARISLHLISFPQFISMIHFICITHKRLVTL